MWVVSLLLVALVSPLGGQGGREGRRDGGTEGRREGCVKTIHMYKIR